MSLLLAKNYRIIGILLFFNIMLEVALRRSIFLSALGFKKVLLSAVDCILGVSPVLWVSLMLLKTGSRDESGVRLVFPGVVEHVLPGELRRR